MNDLGELKFMGHSPPDTDITPFHIRKVNERLKREYGRPEIQHGWSGILPADKIGPTERIQDEDRAMIVVGIVKPQYPQNLPAATVVP
jgi:hypothetical protein